MSVVKLTGKYIPSLYDAGKEIECFFEFYTVTCTYKFSDETGKEVWFDENELSCFIDMIRQLAERRSDVIVI